ncbi:MAG: hypothetical protein EB078_12700, partial [Proteobacteria bacterium]|nr:hypothetical protein [Pseudomonadota bacterium]NDD05756.1 hypothetical protein [Pseudomonadota bacterium]
MHWRLFLFDLGSKLNLNCGFRQKHPLALERALIPSSRVSNDQVHHEESHFNASDTVRDIVIGMADGLTVPFALAAGLSSAVESN